MWLKLLVLLSVWLLSLAPMSAAREAAESFIQSLGKPIHVDQLRFDSLEWHIVRADYHRKRLSEAQKQIPEAKRAKIRAEEEWKKFSHYKTGWHTLEAEGCVLDDPTQDNLATCLCSTCIWVGVWEFEKKVESARLNYWSVCNAVKCYRKGLGDSLAAIEEIENPVPNPDDPHLLLDDSQLEKLIV